MFLFLTTYLVSKVAQILEQNEKYVMTVALIDQILPKL